MAKFRGEKDAFGRPGIEPRWTHGCKDGVGTAYSGDSRVWFTIWNGCITEVYYPTIDRPQIRDLQLLVTDGTSLFHEEKRHLKTRTERSSSHALAYRITNTDPDGRYRIVKEVFAAPHLACVLSARHSKVMRTSYPSFDFMSCAPLIFKSEDGGTTRT
jgi:glucoamylase